MDDKITAPQEAVQALERSEATEGCIYIPETENGYYEPQEKGWSNK